MSFGLAIDALRKSYGSLVAVDGFDLSVRQGEFFSLVGPSGCGKTTVLRMIAGLIEPDDGCIKLVGEDITFLAPHRRHIGLVFQSYALFPHMSVFENVAFGLRRRGIAAGEIRLRVDRFLSLVRLDTMAARLPRQLSGGQQQRVALARALAIEPRLLLLDEPLSNLDAQLRDDMRLELKRLQLELGITTLFVTHDQTEALTMSDRIMVMNRGRGEQVGTPAEIYRQPATPFVAGFIGRSNFLAGELQDRDAQGCTVRLSPNITVRAGAGADLPVGTRVKVVLRHEAVQILAAPQGGSENAFPATVAFVAFAGATSQYVLRLADGLEIQAEIPAAACHAERGASVFAGWQREDMMVMPAAESEK